MKVLVCGGRDFDDVGFLFKELDDLSPDCVISGGARGADKFAAQWASSRQVNLFYIPAKWKEHGKKAGYMRNSEMLEFNPDLVMAFPGGKGTDMMVSLAVKKGIPIKDLRSS